MIREHITKFIQDNVSGDDVSIMLSGGYDSVALLVCCFDIGLKVHPVTFYIEGKTSTDIEQARVLAERFKMDLTEVVLPCGILQVKTDVKTIESWFNTARKTAIQCIWPFMYAAKKTVSSQVLSGICADTLFGNTKSMSILRGVNFKEFQEERLKKIADLHDSSYDYIREVFSMCGCELIAPFKQCAPLIDDVLALPADKLTRKKALVEEFPELAELSKKSVNLQIGSGIRDLHEDIAKAYGYDNVNRWYNSLLKKSFL